jgi:hypothetical protein
MSRAAQPSQGDGLFHAPTRDGPQAVGELGGDALVAIGDVPQNDALDGRNSSPVDRRCDDLAVGG